MTTARNPFAFNKPITLDSLDDLFAHHRAVAGGWTMKEDGDGDGGGDGGGGDEPPTFEPITSQEDLDKVVGRRLAREREKFADYEDLKKKAGEFDAAQEAAKTEQEKAVDAARAEGEKSGRSASDARVVAAEARAAAATWQTKDAEGNVSKFNIGPTSLVRLLDLSGVTVGEDGEVDAAKLKEKLDELAAAEPGLVSGQAPSTKKPGPRPDRSQGGGSSGDDERPGSIAEARRRAREEREARAGKTTKTA